MTMVCSRVDCAERATALLVYDPRGAAAWLRDRDPVGDRGQGIALCGSHADRASVPLGWTLTDERSPMFSGDPGPLVDVGDRGVGRHRDTADRADAASDLPTPATGLGTVEVVDDEAVGRGPGAGADPCLDDVPEIHDGTDDPGGARGDDDSAAGADGDHDADVLTLWADQPTDHDDPGDASTPRSPLLARAFRAAHRQ